MQAPKIEHVNQVDVASLFQEAGFEFHGQMKDFVGGGSASRTEFGIIVAGLIPKRRTWLDGLPAVCRLGDGEVDYLAPPSDGPVAGKPWLSLNLTNRAGWSAGLVKGSHKPGGNRYYHAYIRKPDDELIPMYGPEFYQTVLYDMNEAGQVVGWYYRHPERRGFVWSREHGLTDLGEDGRRYVQSMAINKHGVAVGKAEQDRINQPRIWLPPKEPEGPYQMLSPDPPKGQEGTFAIDINDQGVVLMSASIRLPRPDRAGRTYHIAKPYLWTQAGGYTPIETPGIEYAAAKAITNNGTVLLRCWEKLNFPNHYNSLTANYYLHHEGKTIRIPDYPNSRFTDYKYMSKDGLITGDARLATTDNSDDDESITFVISLTDQGKPKGD